MQFDVAAVVDVDVREDAFFALLDDAFTLDGVAEVLIVEYGGD